MTTLAGVEVGGAVGGFTGALVGLGVPEYEATRCEGRLQKGGILVSVHCDTSEEINRAKEVLKHTAAEDISSAGESSVSGSQRATRKRSEPAYITGKYMRTVASS